MKTFVITIEIEHTDRSFERPEVQEFIDEIGSPKTNFKKQLKKAFKETILGEKAESIEITWGIKTCGK